MIIYSDELNKKVITDELEIPREEHCDPVKTILLIGNGFDIRAGLKSSFLDCLIYITFACILYKCDKAGYIRNDVKLPVSDGYAHSKQLEVLVNGTDKETYEQCFAFATSNLGELIFKHLFPRTECANNFFERITSSVFESDSIPIFTNDEKLNTCSIGKLLRNKQGNIDQLLGLAINSLVKHIENEFADIKGNINLWVDVESIIEMIITGSEEIKEKYNCKEDIKRDYISSKSFLNGLELFEILLDKYLKRIQSIDITREQAELFFKTVQDKYLQSVIIRSHKRIENFDISNPNIVINYNYTNIAEKYFKAINHKPDFLYINGSLNPSKELLPKEISTNIVIGYTNTDPIKFKVAKELFPFEKKSRRIIKNTHYIDICKIINNELFELVIMGHSCGIADSDVFQKLIASEYLKTALVLCHSLEDLISSFNNIRSMVGEKKFSELMTFEKEKITKNLYFAVEDLE